MVIFSYNELYHLILINCYVIIALTSWVTTKPFCVFLLFYWLSFLSLSLGYLIISLPRYWGHHYTNWHFPLNCSSWATWNSFCQKPWRSHPNNRSPKHLSHYKVVTFVISDIKSYRKMFKLALQQVYILFHMACGWFVLWIYCFNMRETDGIVVGCMVLQTE